ncbi:MAG: hypothetical protein JWM16_6382 [Verrucomicrobiales bacterium]|nr:hypothetical protein [Verrucomicrobiales bacterium]
MTENLIIYGTFILWLLLWFGLPLLLKQRGIL